MVITFFVSFVIFIGASLAFAIALAQLAHFRSTKNKIHFSAFFCYSYGLLYSGLVFSRAMVDSLPFLYCTHMPFIYLALPLTYLSLKAILGDTYWEKHDWWHLVLPIVGIPLNIPIWLLPEAKKIELLERSLAGEFVWSEELQWATFFVALLLVIYNLYLMSLTWQMAMKKPKRGSLVFYLVIILTVIHISLALLVFSIILNSMDLIAFAIMGLGICFPALYLLSQFFPEMMYQLKAASYQKTTLATVDKTEIKERLLRLMNDDNIYADCDLSLNLLAEKLNLRSHQLSEFLNTNYKLNFNGYINNYRVKAAGDLLATTDLSIAEIRKKTGFNSDSYFNFVFRKYNGKSPSAFRKSKSGQATQKSTGVSSSA